MKLFSSVGFYVWVFLALCVGFWVGAVSEQGYYRENPGELFPTATPTSCMYSSINTDTLLVELNDYRIAHNLPQLTTDLNLQNYAGVRAQEIEVTGDLTHTSEYGNFWAWEQKHSDPAPPDVHTVWEDIIQNESNPCKTIQDFASSPSHDATMLSPTAESVGVGYQAGVVVLEIGNE